MFNLFFIPTLAFLAISYNYLIWLSFNSLMSTGSLIGYIGYFLATLITGFLLFGTLALVYITVRLDDKGFEYITSTKERGK